MNHKIHYKLNASKKAITLTLTVPNDADARRWLHDLVAIRIAESGDFIANVYGLVPGRSARQTGKFTPRFKTYCDAPPAL